MTTQPFYWTAPEWVRSFIKRVYKPKDTYTITAVRNDKDEWTFNYSFFRNEPFVMGAARVIDAWYYDINGKQAVAGDVMTMTASVTKPVRHYSRMEYATHNTEDWSSYYDTSSGDVADFCPVFKVMWGGFPKTVYITINK
jgi:hypothetical protein